MVTIGMNYKVVDGKQNAFVAMFNKVVETMTKDPGHRASHLYREVNDPCSFLIVSDWSDRAAFEAFIASDTFRRVADWGKERILSDRPLHQIYQPQPV